MPKIAGMKFPYTEQGMREAEKYYKQTDKPMELEDGGLVPPNSVVQQQKAQAEMMQIMQLKAALEQEAATAALVNALGNGNLNNIKSNVPRTEIPASVKALKRENR